MSHTTSHTKILLSALGLVIAASFGCRVEGNLMGPASTSSGAPPSEPPPPAPAGDGPGAGGAGHHAGHSSGGAGGPSCEYPANHCLDQDVVFASPKGWERNYIYVKPAKVVAQADASGATRVMAVSDGEEMATEHVWQTRPAGPEDLRVGQLVFMLHKQDRDNAYRAPKDLKEAHGRWWLSRIASVETVAQAGEVILVSGHRVKTDALRVPVEAALETVTVNGAEDAHYFKPDHWIVGDKPLPAKNYAYVAVAAPVQAPSAATRGDGQFIVLSDGSTKWSRHAWRTRPATKEDLTLGRHVFLLHKQDRDNNYRAPKDRAESLTGRWWVAKITDTSELYKNVVQVGGKYRVYLDAVRVIVE